MWIGLEPVTTIRLFISLIARVAVPDDSPPELRADCVEDRGRSVDDLCEAATEFDEAVAVDGQK
jgi:hypothetical protein